jgi:hypothetical protein
MPAGLPGSSAAENAANPSAGAFIIMDPLSGPKGSPLDTPGTVHASTGCMCNGIGMESQANYINAVSNPNFPDPINQAGFDDDYIPGTERDGAGTENVVNSNMMYIGGGRSELVAGTGADGNGAPANSLVSVPDPYTAGILILGAGNGASRDAGAGPAFTGFPMKMVTAIAQVVNGADIEAGFANRTGLTMEAGESAFGSDALASAIPS